MSFDNCVYANFNFEFNKVIKKVNEKRYSDLIFICIGTNKIVGDSFGPIVGEILKRNVRDGRIKVIGDLTNNINSKNIKNIKTIARTPSLTLFPNLSFTSTSLPYFNLSKNS